ncbi:MAG: alpha/beta hydrolase [Crocinitomicaceae bacterium]|nr:alpha/beta hydrolase [Crocinitomicaceae bacterium]
MDYELKKEGRYEYIEEGEGPVIVFLHGLFGELSNFKEVLPHFVDKYTVVLPLLPIYTLPIISANVKYLAKFLHEFLDYKKYDQVTLMGNSLGGHTALVYTAKHLDRVHSMVLTGSSGLYENSFGGGFVKRGNYDVIKQKVEATFYDPAIATKELVDQCYEVVNDKGHALRMIGIAKSAIRHNMSNELANLDLPTCLIWGKQDIITPPEVAEEFHEKLPDSELHWIDKCGHAAMMEQPEEFNRILSIWLDKVHNR